MQCSAQPGVACMSQVQLQLVTATVKLFLKKPTEKPQAMIQLVLTYATQETDNPDLRDRACALHVQCDELRNEHACTDAMQAVLGP